MSAESPHLDVAELLAGSDGGAADGPAQPHLANCPDCRTDAERWEAVAAGVRHLVASIEAPPLAGLERAANGRPRSYRPGRYLRLGVAAGAAVAVVAGLLVTVTPGAPRPALPIHTAWQPARPLPRSGTPGPGGAAGTWRLASYFVSTGWREHTVGPEPGNLTCPAATTCYIQGDNAVSASGPADMDSFYVSTDGGADWSVLPVPPGVAFTSKLACGSVTDCVAGASYHGRPVLVRTVDGGHSWTIAPLPGTVGQILQLSCSPATATCEGLAAAPAVVWHWLPNRAGRRFLTIAGGHVRTTAFPAGDWIQSVNCPAAGHCVAAGVRRSGRATVDVALTTSDGGTHWAPGALPKGLASFPPSLVRCADVSHCYLLGYAGPRAARSEVLASADGGHTWAARPLPATSPDPYVSDIACPAAATCYAAGTEAVPQQFANGSNGGRAVVFITHDGGRHWTPVTFTEPARVPRGVSSDAFMDVGDIQCPQAGACVALGVSDQGSRTTPVYTSRSSS